MTDFFDDDSGFWDTNRSEPTIQLNRVRKSPERTRTHRVVAKDPTPTGGLTRTDRAARTDRTDRTGGVARTGATRTHGEPSVRRDDDSGMVWVEPTAGGWAGIGGRSRRRGTFFGNVDPRLLSVGALSVAAVLAVPLFGALGGDDSPDDVRSVASASSTIATTATTLAPTTTAVVITAPVDDDGSDSGSGSTSRSASAGDAPSDETGGMSSGSGSGSGTGSGDGAGAGSGVLAAPAVRVAAQCGNPYEVAAGDYWMGIASKIDYPLDELLEYNEATSDTPLYPGSVVCLPLGTSIAPPTTAAPATTEAPASTATPTSAAPAPETTVATTQPATTEAPETTRPPATTQAPDDDDDDDVPTGPIPSGGEVEQMIRDIWPDDQEERALEIAWRESNYRPDVTSGTGCCHGVFQIHEQHLSWLADYGITSVSQLFDARTNIQAAYYLYQRSGGWGPWALG